MEYNRGMNAAKFEYSVNLVNDSDNKMILDYCLRQLIISSKNMDCNYDIDKMYKDIEGYLGNIDCYKNIKLEINKIRNNKVINTGLLVLENGVCKEFMITRNDRCIYLNSNGEWSYNFNGRFYTVSSLGKDDKNITYSVNADNDSILKYVMDTKGYVEDVVSDVDDTKKLVKSMFNKDRK